MEKKKCYLFVNTLDKLRKSSSGGAFLEICETLKNISDNNLIVYGVTYDENMNTIYTRAKNEDEISLFCGSKYVMSNLNNCFSSIVEDLTQGKYVLFVGTPCQVAGAKSFISSKGISSDKLYLVDLICHGTISPSIWKKYVEWLEHKHNSKMIDYRFRYKGAKWKNYASCVKYENGKTYVNAFENKSFMNLFFKNLIIQKGCFSCKFANLNRVGDITIGDFWGAKKLFPNVDSSMGVSEIIVNTKKGELLLESIEKQISDDKILLTCNLDNCLKYQHNLNSPTSMPTDYEDFNNYLKSSDNFGDVLKKFGNYNIKGLMIYLLKKIYWFFK